MKEIKKEERNETLIKTLLIDINKYFIPKRGTAL